MRSSEQSKVCKSLFGGILICFDSHRVHLMGCEGRVPDGVQSVLADKYILATCGSVRIHGYMNE